MGDALSVPFIVSWFQLNHKAMVDKLIQQEKLNHCHGLTLNKDDDDSNIESCCVTHDARHPRDNNQQECKEQCESWEERYKSLKQQLHPDYKKEGQETVH